MNFNPLSWFRRAGPAHVMTGVELDDLSLSVTETLQSQITLRCVSQFVFAGHDSTDINLHDPFVTRVVLAYIVGYTRASCSDIIKHIGVKLDVPKITVVVFQNIFANNTAAESLSALLKIETFITKKDKFVSDGFEIGVAEFWHENSDERKEVMGLRAMLDQGNLK